MRVREYARTHTQTHTLDWMTRMCPQCSGCFGPFMHQVCLPMQNSTDGCMGGMGVASLATELLWVGDPIAIQRTSTWSMSDMPREDIPGVHIVLFMQL